MTTTPSPPRASSAWPSAIVLEPAYIAVALPPGSALKKPLDRALIEITGSQEWRRIEDSYFGR